MSPCLQGLAKQVFSKGSKGMAKKPSIHSWEQRAAFCGSHAKREINTALKQARQKNKWKNQVAHQIKPEGASKELHSCLGLQEKPLRKNRESNSSKYVGQQNGSRRHAASIKSPQVLLWSPKPCCLQSSPAPVWGASRAPCLS